jgi:hypothetical protein
MDIVVWLRSLGLEQYEAAFRENAITAREISNNMPGRTASDSPAPTSRVQRRDAELGGCGPIGCLQRIGKVPTSQVDPIQAIK